MYPTIYLFYSQEYYNLYAGIPIPVFHIIYRVGSGRAEAVQKQRYLNQI